MMKITEIERRRDRRVSGAVSCSSTEFVRVVVAEAVITDEGANISREQLMMNRETQKAEKSNLRERSRRDDTQVTVRRVKKKHRCVCVHTVRRISL
jgi:hypothetical protein